MKQVVVIGGGAAGMATALRLADQGYQVTLIEKNTLGSGASGNNPGRMGLGFHYADIPTALSYLRASIKVQREFPDHLVGKERPDTDPIRHGRYLFTKDSTVPISKILETYKAIQAEYTRLVKEDPKNEVFGPPDKLFRVLTEDEYKDKVNADIVVGGVETAEHLFNWSSFLSEIRKKIESHKNITLLEHTNVVNISRNLPKEKRFTVECEQGEEQLPIKIDTDFIVNSTWQNIERINDFVGIRFIPESRTNRLKVLLEVELPESLKGTSSKFFCMGQHCMMSNLGNGRAMMTYAKITNLETSSGLKISENAERLIRGDLSETERKEIAEAILKGVSEYIPEMKDAKIRGLKFGIVQTKGNLRLCDLQNPTHDFNKRDDHNVRSEQIGLISNPCMKLFYFLDNADLVSELLEEHVRASKILQNCYLAICNEAPDDSLSPSTKRMIKDKLDIYEASSISESDSKDIVTAVLKSLTFMKKLENRFFSPGKQEPMNTKDPGKASRPS